MNRLLGLLILVAFVSSIESSCPPGFVRKSVISKNSSDSSCVCVSEIPGLKDYVTCSGNQSQLLNCHCIANVSDSEGTFIGPCAYGCFMAFRSFYYPLNDSYNAVNDYVCGKLNRGGMFCSKCKTNFSFPVYTYSLKCVECHAKAHKYNWLRYIAVAYLPLTAFLIAVICFRISVTKPLMEIFVLTCQIVFAPVQLKLLLLAFEGSHSRQFNIIFLNIIKTCATIFGMWNLDFFRALYHPFCIKENVTMLFVFALEYGIAAYPLVLILVMYTCVELHSRGCRLLNCIWRPFHYILARFRRQMDIQESLIDAFATFLVLSYVKLSTVSADILIPITLHNVTVETSVIYTMFYQPDTKLFHGEHLTLAIFAIFVLITITIMPVILFSIYPYIQKHVNTRSFGGHLLHTVMETFQGHYKDGTNGTRDCRSFSAVYMALRLSLLLVYSTTLSINFYPIACGLVILTALSVAIVQPYKHKPHNLIHMCLLIVVALFYLSIYSVDDAILHPYTQVALCSAAVCIALIFIYILLVVVHCMFHRKTWFRRLFKQCGKILYGGDNMSSDQEHNASISGATERSPLLDVSHSNSERNIQ